MPQFAEPVTVVRDDAAVLAAWLAALMVGLVAAALGGGLRIYSDTRRKPT